MNTFHKIFVLLFGILFISVVLNAQESNITKLPVQLAIPAKASVGIAGADVVLSFNGKGTEQKLKVASKSSVWLNYSSIVEGSTKNSIYVSLASNNLPAEIIINLKTGEDVGAGSGEVGKPSTSIILSNNPQPIITNIGSCFTGQGVNKGHLLTYSWKLDPDYDPNLFKIDDLKIEAGVVYTIVTN